MQGGLAADVAADGDVAHPPSRTHPPTQGPTALPTHPHHNHTRPLHLQGGLDVAADGDVGLLVLVDLRGVNIYVHHARPARKVLQLACGQGAGLGGGRGQGSGLGRRGGRQAGHGVGCWFWTGRQKAREEEVVAQEEEVEEEAAEEEGSSQLASPCPRPADSHSPRSLVSREPFNGQTTPHQRHAV